MDARAVNHTRVLMWDIATGGSRDVMKLYRMVSLRFSFLLLRRVHFWGVNSLNCHSRSLCRYQLFAVSRTGCHPLPELRRLQHPLYHFPHVRALAGGGRQFALVRLACGARRQRQCGNLQDVHAKHRDEECA